MKKDIELRNGYFLRIVPEEYCMNFSLINKSDGEDILITGFLSFDGCMNWDTGEVMYHFCGKDDAIILNEAFLKLWELGAEHIPHWIGKYNKG